MRQENWKKIINTEKCGNGIGRVKGEKMWRCWMKIQWSPAHCWHYGTACNSKHIWGLWWPVHMKKLQHQRVCQQLSESHTMTELCHCIERVNCWFLFFGSISVTPSLLITADWVTLLELCMEFPAQQQQQHKLGDKYCEVVSVLCITRNQMSVGWNGCWLSVLLTCYHGTGLLKQKWKLLLYNIAQHSTLTNIKHK